LEGEGIFVHQLQAEEIRLEDSFIHYIEMEEEKGRDRGRGGSGASSRRNSWRSAEASSISGFPSGFR